MHDIGFFLDGVPASSTRLVLAAAGDAASTILNSLGTLRACPWVLSAVVHSSFDAMEEWLSGGVDEVCSAITARSLAMTAFLRAIELGGGSRNGDTVAGIGLTACFSDERRGRARQTELPNVTAGFWCSDDATQAVF